MLRRAACQDCSSTKVPANAKTKPVKMLRFFMRSPFTRILQKKVQAFFGDNTPKAWIVGPYSLERRGVPAWIEIGLLAIGRVSPSICGGFFHTSRRAKHGCQPRVSKTGPNFAHRGSGQKSVNDAWFSEFGPSPPGVLQRYDEGGYAHGNT